MMCSQEIETAIREKIPFVILIGKDKAYDLVKWKIELGLGRSSHISFANPDFVKQGMLHGQGAAGIRIAQFKKN
jgi:acetolactate synthase-1/2/3 large subunit